MWRQLLRAGDQFIVPSQLRDRTVIAGYPWFNDWGRDTLCFARISANNAAV